MTPGPIDALLYPGVIERHRLAECHSINVVLHET